MGRPKKDLTGQRFGSITVLKLDETKPRGQGKHVYWICQCDCGKIFSRESSYIQHSKNQHCGKDCALLMIKPGARFGNCIVLNKTDMRSPNGGSIIYDCLCDCGNKFQASATNLRAGRVKRCPQHSKSNGVLKIEKILIENKISYIEEKRFDDLVGKENIRLPFDFYVNNSYIIEFDGSQHFFPTSTWGGDKGLHDRQEHDIKKNQYCKEHNIPIIRIPYWAEDELTVKDLIPETSQYLI